MSDDDSATVTVLTLGHSGFEVRGTYREGASVSSSVVEGFRVRIDEVSQL